MPADHICPNCAADRRQRIYPSSRRVLLALLEGPKTVRELARELSISGSSIEDAVRFLREYGVVYVAAWVRGSAGIPSRKYGLGSGPDAPKLDAKPAALKSREWRERGGDSKRAQRLRNEAKKIVANSTFAGLLGVKTK